MPSTELRLVASQKPDLYIHRILKVISGDARISGDALQYLAQVITNVAGSILDTAEVGTTLSHRLRPYSQRTKGKSHPSVKMGKVRSTVFARDIRNATLLVVPGQLGHHSAAKINEAAMRYRASGAAQSGKTSRTKRAGLVFSVPLAEKYIRNFSAFRRVSSDASVALAAVLQYVVAEILDLALKITLDIEEKTISPKTLNQAVRHDQELNMLMTALYGAAYGPQVPHISAKLLPTKRRKRTKQ